MQYRDRLTQNALLVLLSWRTKSGHSAVVCSSLLTLHRANEVLLNRTFRFLSSTRLLLSVQTHLGIARRKTVGFMCLFIISLVSDAMCCVLDGNGS